MTHTPGPYHITRHDDRVWIEANVGGVVARLAIMDDGAGTQPGNADLFAAAPDMLVALLAFERAAHLNNVCNDDPSASLEWMDASDDAVSRCAAVLKRLRDDGVIA